MERQKLLELTEKIVRKISEAGIRQKDVAVERELAEILKKTYRVYRLDSLGVLMYIRGQALRNQIPLNQIVALNNACWNIAEESLDESERIFFRRLSVNLKPKTVELFRAILSGGEVISKNETNFKHYSFSRIPEETRLLKGVRFTVSRMNVKAILKSYDNLIEKAKVEGNKPMGKHWEIQKETFWSLLNHIAPRLLEVAP